MGTSFAKYRVVGKNAESCTITSFLLSPVDGGDVAAFEPGQYLTVRLTDDVTRTYTVSSSPSERRHYRISVKREPSAGPGLPPGQASGILHDTIRSGSLLDILEPRGAFFLNQSSTRPVVLLSGGVGITPMMSMLHALSRQDREVCFIHACENGPVHAFGQEVGDLVRDRKNLRSFLVYRNPTIEDREAGRYQREGVVTPELLRSLLPQGSCDHYLCGPPGFMRAVYTSLREFGVSKGQINYEFFGPSTILEEEEPRASSEAEATTAVVFERSQKCFDWAGFKGSLLEFAEMNGIEPDFSCRVGACNTCECRLVSGEVTYFGEPAETPPPGRVLLCVTRPSSAEVRLEL